jgi:hypothetical protein
VQLREAAALMPKVADDAQRLSWLKLKSFIRRSVI